MAFQLPANYRGVMLDASYWPIGEMQISYRRFIAAVDIDMYADAHAYQENVTDNILLTRRYVVPPQNFAVIFSPMNTAEEIRTHLYEFLRNALLEGEETAFFLNAIEVE